MDSGDNKLKAFDFFKEAAIQLITLALGAVVFSATFYKDILAGASQHHVLLEWSWALFVLSIIFGVLVVGTLSWELNYAADPKNLDIYSARGTALVQLIAFLLAVGLFALFVGMNMTRAAAKAAQTSVLINGPVNATGSITASGPITARGPVFAAGSTTARGPVTATGPVTITSIAKPPRAGRRRRQALP